ncbi:MAG: DUF1090 domain-containing protein [Snodgrassella sp.]|nr:DUF1090 domain-containing protein [Snodgrassella sp.]
MNMVTFAKSLMITAAISVTIPAMANDIWPTCAEKKQQIEIQLQHAMANQNQKKISRLNNEKTAITNHCSDSVLRQQYVDKVNKYNAKVVETQQKLITVQAKRDAKKISKVMQRLDENKRELLEAKEKLARFDQVRK